LSPLITQPDGQICADLGSKVVPGQGRQLALGGVTGVAGSSSETTSTDNLVVAVMLSSSLERYLKVEERFGSLAANSNSDSPAMNLAGSKNYAAPS